MSPIEKVRVPVQLGWSQQPPREGWFALRSETEHGRPETVLELLNHPVTVLPFIEPDASVVLLTRRNIDWVVTGPSVEEHFIAPSYRSVTRKQRVEVRFMDDRRVEGTIQWEASKEHLRVSDELNGVDDFFPLRTERGVWIANLRRIRETRLIGMPGA